MDSLQLGVFGAIDASAFASSKPLAAGAQFISPWIDVSGSGDAPSFNIQISADQAGSLTVFEGEVPASIQDKIGGVSVLANVAATASGTINDRYMRYVYTNGPVAQSVFSIALTLAGSQVLSTSSLDTRRTLELILRELRMHSLFLAELKGPSTLAPNLPFGPASSSI